MTFGSKFEKTMRGNVFKRLRLHGGSVRANPGGRPTGHPPGFLHGAACSLKSNFRSSLSSVHLACSPQALTEQRRGQQIGPWSVHPHRSVKNNVYTSIPGCLKDAPTRAERRKLVRFITTCFAVQKSPAEDYPDALKIVLAVLALVVQGYFRLRFREPP